MSDPPSPPSSYPNELDAVKARQREREAVASLSVLVQVCMDVLGIGKDPDVQAHGVLSRMGAYDRELADMKLVNKRLERYGRICALAAIVLIVAAGMNVYVTWRNELSSVPAPPAPPIAARAPL